MPDFAAISSRLEVKTETFTTLDPGRYFSASTPAIDRFDYARATGPLNLNSLIVLGMQWIRRNIVQGRVVVGTEDEGEYTEVEEHPLPLMLKNPNPWASWSDILGGVSDDLVLYGEGFWLKARDGIGVVKEVYWAPNCMMEVMEEFNPRLSRTAGPIRGYRYSVGGYTQTYLPSEVVHFRERMDPWRPGRGLSCLLGQERNAAAITAAERYQVYVLLNAHAGKVLMPREAGVWQGSVEESEMNAVAHTVEAGVSGANSGRIARTNFPMDLLDVGLGPESMALDRITNLPVGMVLGAMGLNAMALDLPSSEPTSTYANKAVAVRSCYDNGIIPRQERIADTIDKQLLKPDFPDALAQDYTEGTGSTAVMTTRMVVADCVWWDRRYVEALQEDANDRATRSVSLRGAGITTLNEARQLNDLPPVDGGDVDPAEEQQQAQQQAMDQAQAQADAAAANGSVNGYAGKTLANEDDDDDPIEIKALQTNRRSSRGRTGNFMSEDEYRARYIDAALGTEIFKHEGAAALHRSATMRGDHAAAAVHKKSMDKHKRLKAKQKKFREMTGLSKDGKLVGFGKVQKPTKAHM